MSLTPDAPPINEDSTFWIASCTKLFTTVAAMQCVEKGLITLDEDISRILPEWSSPDILTGFDKESGEPLLKKATKKITLRLMLTHSSGMGYDFLSPDLMKWREWHKQDVKALEGDIVRPVYLLPCLTFPDFSPPTRSIC
jgi:CubicO group peptidase (beta-lactamase class C family)